MRTNERFREDAMSKKKDVQVVINGKVYTLSGYETEEYLQKIATYINQKISEFDSMDNYRKLNSEYQNILLSLNIADDYFKAKKQVDLYEKEIINKDKQIYDIRHEIIETQIKEDSSTKLVEEYKRQLVELQNKIDSLESETKLNE